MFRGFRVFEIGVNKSMKFVFDKCVLNVAPFTNPTLVSKSDKQIVESIKLRFSPKAILARFQDSLPIAYCLLGGRCHICPAIWFLNPDQSSCQALRQMDYCHPPPNRCNLLRSKGQKARAQQGVIARALLNTPFKAIFNTLFNNMPFIY